MVTRSSGVRLNSDRSMPRGDMLEDVKTSVLRLEWKRREGGGGKTQRDYLDFVVDDKSLSEIIGGDLISPLGWFIAEENAKLVRWLLLEEPADFANNRRSFCTFVQNVVI